MSAPTTAERAWSVRWTYWIRSRVTIATLSDTAGPQLQEVLDEVARLDEERLTSVTSIPAGEFLAAVTVEELRDEAVRQLDAHGYLHNGKWNAVVDERAEAVLDLVDLPAFVRQRSGVRVGQPRVATYIAYRRTGEFLDFHLDDFSYGSINLILCLEHTTADGVLSETVFLTPAGPERYPLRAGEAILFDGAVSPHARTPLRPGEQVLLLSYGFDAIDDDRATRTADMPEPGHRPAGGQP